MSDTVKYLLDETRLPEAWYNVAADLPEPPPPRATCAVRSRTSATSSSMRSRRRVNSSASRSSCEVRTVTEGA